MRIAGRAVLLAMALTVMSPLLSAYYYYVFFASGTGPYAPLPAHFDLNAIKDNTVQYLISDQPPSALMPGDNLTAIYSQIRQAAEAWNGVASSSLRLHFGGTRNMATPQTVAGIDVVFDDNMPPGIVAQTTVTFPSDLTFLSAKGTTFVPILRSKLQLRKDLTAAGYRQSSYTDAFFMTLVHEFGHAMGLQHTFTSATMSTAITRATTRGLPLAADDVSGISLLYPAGGYASSTGGITGRGRERRGHQSGERRGAFDQRRGGQRDDAPRWNLRNRRHSAGPILHLRPSTAAGSSRRRISRQYRSSSRPAEG